MMRLFDIIFPPKYIDHPSIVEKTQRSADRVINATREFKVQTDTLGRLVQKMKGPKPKTGRIKQVKKL